MKDRLVQIYYTRYFWLTVLWYRLTQLVTGLTKPSVAVTRFTSAKEVGEYVATNATYLLDPLGGKFDFITHPAVVQARILNHEDAGDCDDHAAFWLSALLGSGITKKAWLGLVWFDKPNGGRAGHAVAVWVETDPASGEELYFWADYHAPNRLRLPVADGSWADAVVKYGYGVHAIAAVLVEIKGVSHSDGLKFGKCEGRAF